MKTTSCALKTLTAAPPRVVSNKPKKPRPNVGSGQFVLCLETRGAPAEFVEKDVF